LLTDMNQVLGRTAGNALEVREAIDWLTGASDDPRLTQVVLALGAEMLVLGGLDADVGLATNRLIAVRESGVAAERFQEMVTALGGPSDLIHNPAAHLRQAAMTYRVDASRDGYIESIDTRSVGLAVVALGGGRLRVEDEIDHSVGLTDVVAIGEHVDRDRPLAIVHARSESEAMVAAEVLRAACSIGDVPPLPSPVVASRITA
jgi:thymidine phosphorylase